MLIGIQQQQYYFNSNIVYDDVAFLAVGAVSSSDTGICFPGYPTSPAPALNNAMICVVSTKTQAAIVEVPTGWRRIGEYIAATRNNGSNAGPVRETILFKESDGTESGTLQINAEDGLGNPSNSVLAVIYNFSKDSRLYWDVKCYGGHHNTVATTSYSARSYHLTDSQPDDLYFLSSFTNANTIDWSAQAIAQPGVTFDTIHQEILEFDTSAGNNQCHVSSLFKVISGEVEDFMTFTMTGTTSTASAPLGISAFIRIRQSTAPSQWEPSGLRVFRGSDMPAQGSPASNDPVFNGNVAFTIGPDAGSLRLRLENFGGRQCMRLTADLTTGFNNRTEIAPASWENRYMPGTQIIEETRFETGATVPDMLTALIMGQIHTGTPNPPLPGSEYPLYYYGWAFVGETGWDNNPGYHAVGGEFIISQKISGIRSIFPAILWAANETYRVFFHVRYDYASGNPCLKWKVNDVLLIEDYVSATITSTDAELGSNSNVGGVPKKGIYLHNVNDADDAADLVALGFTGIDLKIPCSKVIIQRPSDIDYIQVADLTDNNNPIYDFVNTASE